ncbi:hypothetical protein LCL96_01405 [Rossellomorea aquimaris]|uniref:adenylate/guanylate cyclase domain-containing protein n=1 Tax=Rossellomorea aquimaris TaxID=189382 RepID=UPI001CD6CFF9|nr:adenylate/guanylate cyclase domain-containing protein [Rossellomorea aquimaris]MCA1057571.1 hypothetical protein [Rossellomorea aquimaris]
MKKISNNWTLENLETVNEKIGEVLDTPMEVEPYSGDTVPSINDLDDKNEGLLVECAILFVDIRGSTTLSDSSWAKSMAKIYRAFVRAMVLSINHSGGSVRQIVGDRVMGVFVNGDKKATEKAVEAARAILTVVDYYFNPKCKSEVNGKEIECGIGLDYGKVLLTQVGMKLQEEESKDLVWAGKIANIASKHTDMAEPGEIFSTKRFFDNLPIDYKTDASGNELWQEDRRFKSNGLFEGFIIKNYYLDCILDNTDKQEIESSQLKEIEVPTENPLVNIEVAQKKIEEFLQRRTERKVDETLDIALNKLEQVVRREEQLKKMEKDLVERESKVNQKNQELRLKELKINERTLLAEYEIKVNILYDQMDDLSLTMFRTIYEEIVGLGRRSGKSNIQVKSDLHYWKLINFLSKKDVGWAYQLIEEQLMKAQASRWWAMPLKDNVIKVIKELHKESAFIESVEYSMEHYESDFVTDDKLELRDILVELGVSMDVANKKTKIIS